MADSTAARLDAVSGEGPDVGAPAAGPVTDSKGAKVLATNSLVNSFVVGDLVITNQGTKVPAGKVDEVRAAALHNHVELHEIS